MKIIPLIIMTLMMSLIGITSYSQEKQPEVPTNEESIQAIKLRLKQSSDYLIKSSNLSIGTAVVGIATSVFSGLLYSGLMPSLDTTAGNVISIGGSVLTLCLGISSLVNKRKGYKALGGLQL